MIYLQLPKIDHVKTIAAATLCCCVYSISYTQSPTDFKTYEQTVPESSFKFRMVPIKSGDFLMGSAASEKGRKEDEGPQQKIHLSAFWMAAYEVTRDELDVFLKDENTSQNSDVDAITRPSPQYIDFSLGMGKEGGYPANSMSQYAALMYCRWLYQKTGIFYRLPTEAEWEYACRAGSNTRYFFGDDSTQLGNYAWYEQNSEDKFHKVGQKQPNAWGLYDMLGNVMEWTLDHYTSTYLGSASTINDPVVAPNKSKYPKTLRGGGYSDKAADLRSASRTHSEPSWNRRDPQIPKSRWWMTDGASVGIRIVRPLQQPNAAEIGQFFKNYLGS
jgi:formylglycine-generating enzyme required for sulfatase activity